MLESRAATNGICGCDFQDCCNNRCPTRRNVEPDHQNSPADILALYEIPAPDLTIGVTSFGTSWQDQMDGGVFPEIKEEVTYHQVVYRPDNADDYVIGLA